METMIGDMHQISRAHMAARVTLLKIIHALEHVYLVTTRSCNYRDSLEAEIRSHT